MLFEARTKKLLFPGDAQGENWSWALEHAPKATRERWRELLRDIDLYKVGHHGSRNATPKSLYQLWDGRGRDLVSLVSTPPGKHGKASNQHEVPRKTLVLALRHLGPLRDTTKTPKRQLSLAVRASLRSNQAFRATPA